MVTLISLTTSLTGCATRTLVIPSDKECIRMREGVAFTPLNNGWFVPDAMMLDILNKMDEKK